jgi:CheY-like chemotaxis protein
MADHLGQGWLRIEFVQALSVLIVEPEEPLARLWGNALTRLGAEVMWVAGQSAAVAALTDSASDVIILNLELTEGSALAVADFAGYRRPTSRVVFVSRSSFFSDGSIFSVAANARAFLPLGTPPEDLAAMVAHYAA